VKGPATSPVARLRGVKKSYRLGDRVVPALRGIDLDIAEPGFYCIMGPSGGGKSTLLHLLGGLDRPDAGTVELAGARIDDMPERELTELRRRRIGIVFQQFNLISTLTALDNVALPAMLDGVARPERLRRAAEQLDRLGLGDRMSHRPDALSGGEQQRVAIARALIFDPIVLLADEPTGNLDTVSSADIWQLCQSLVTERQVTVLMATHEPAAATYSRRVFLLRDGRITDFFDVDHLDAAELATRALRPVR